MSEIKPIGAKMKKWLSMPILFLGLLAAAFGCAKPAVTCGSPGDDSTHHYIQGMELIDDNKLDDAYARFETALYCDDEFAPGYAGAAVAGAVKIASATGKAEQGDLDGVYRNLNLAFKYSRTNEDEFASYLGSMRVYTALRPGKWLTKVEGDYRNAMRLKVDEKKLAYYDGREAATYFMGIAYLEARDFAQARDMFSDIVGGRRDSVWYAPADIYLKKIGP